jgi:hypothetical protein
LSVGKRNNIGMKEVLKRVMIVDSKNLVNMIMVRERVMMIEVTTMIMKRVRMLLTNMKGVIVAVILRHLLKIMMMMMMMMMTTPKWVGVIYLSH